MSYNDGMRKSKEAKRFTVLEDKLDGIVNRLNGMADTLQKVLEQLDELDKKPKPARRKLED